MGLGSFFCAFAVALFPSAACELLLSTRLVAPPPFPLGLAEPEFVPGGSSKAASLLSDFFLGSAFLSFGRRVVTLAIGTVSTLALDRVSISAVTDMPGRNASFSLTRILTSNLVASWLVLADAKPAVLDELAISVTVP